MGDEFRVDASVGGVRLRRVWVPGEPGERPAYRQVGANGGGMNAGSAGPLTADRVIVGFSARSRNNMRWAINALPWEECGERLMMWTVTYPSEFRALAPDGAAVKRHHLLFRKRWDRRWGPSKGMWSFEFQEREAPHVHSYSGRPGAAECRVDADGEPVLSWRSALKRWDELVETGELVAVGFDKYGNRKYKWPWALQQWFEIVGSGDERHRRWGVDVRPCYFGSALENGRRVADYFWRESGKKGRQKVVPEGFGGPGRFWAYWGFKPVVFSDTLDDRVYVHMRRVLMDLRDQVASTAVRNGWRVPVRRRRLRRPRGMDGVWSVSGDGIGTYVLLRRWAESLVAWEDAGRPGAVGSWMRAKEDAPAPASEARRRPRQRRRPAVRHGLQREAYLSDEAIDLLVAERDGAYLSDEAIDVLVAERDGANLSDEAIDVLLAEVLLAVRQAARLI